MASKSDARRAKRRQKQKQKARVRSQRSSRPGPGAPSGRQRGVPVDVAVGWPVSDGWISSTWYEQGPEVHAAFVRQHEDGRVAGALFHLDLGTGQVLEARTVSGSEGQLNAELSRRSSEERPMVQVPGTTVVKAALDCAEYGVARGLEVPPSFESACALFGQLNASDTEVELLLGPEPAGASATKAKRGWWPF